MSAQLTEACRLAKIILKHGYSITVNNGEEDLVARSKNMSDIRKALFTADEEYLYIYSDDKHSHIGCIYLVYEDPADASEMVNDYSTTPAIIEIMKEYEFGLA